MTKQQEHYRLVKSFGNTRVIHFKYLGPTNHRGTRVKLTDKWFGQSKTISYDYRFSTAYEVAINWLLENGWNVTGMNSESNLILLGDWNDKRLND